MRARLIRPDGRTDQISLPDSSAGYDKLCEILGTGAPAPMPLVAMAPGRPGLTLWHDPAAIHTEASRNDAAWRLTDEVGKAVEYIAGPVVLTGAVGSEGDTHALTQGQDMVLAELIGRWAALRKPSAFASLDAARSN